MPARSAGSAAELRHCRRGRAVVGVNIGKNKDTPEVADYVTGACALAEMADYLVVNVSSPNTPGLRDLQATTRLLPLLAGVREALDQVSPHRRVLLLSRSPRPGRRERRRGCRPDRGTWP
jgi:dihydroorotate dehydrogenase